MNEIATVKAQLPDTIEDLSSYVFIGREKLTALKAAIRACNKSEVISEKLNQMKEEEKLLAENVLIAEMRIGELLKEVPKDNPNKRIANGGKSSAVKDLGISTSTAQRYQVLANHPEVVEQAIQNARNADRPVTRQEVLDKVAPTKQERRKQELAQAMESHRQIQEETKGGVIRFDSKKEETENYQVFAINLKHDIEYWMPQVIKLKRWNDKDLKRIVKELKPETKQAMAEQISEATKILCRIGKELISAER